MESFLNLICNMAVLGAGIHLRRIYGEDSSILGTSNVLVPFWDGESKRAPLTGES